MSPEPLKEHLRPPGSMQLLWPEMLLDSEIAEFAADARICALRENVAI